MKLHFSTQWGIEAPSADPHPRSGRPTSISPLRARPPPDRCACWESASTIPFL